mgnify:CR=1 FL=1
MLTINLFNGLVYGALLIVMCSGLALIYGLRRVVNFAHGSFFMVGIYVAYSLVERLSGALGFWVALPLAALIVGVLGLGTAVHGAQGALTLGLIAVALVCGTLLLRRQAGHPAPMLALDLFKRPVFALSSLTAICAFSAQGLAFVSLPFLLQAVLGHSQVETGFLMTPWPAVVAVMALVAGRLADRVSLGLLCGIGLLMLSVGMAALATLGTGATAFDIGWRMALCGAGFGFFQSPNLKALMTSAPLARSGGASGIVAISRLLGQTLGASLVALCFHVSLGSGPLYALWLGCVFALVGAVASGLRLLPYGKKPL